jgi:adenylate cyclase
MATRFGLHRDTVMVGHFGAPDRLSYTALGDGVNVASRLEGLNKQYGTTIIVSDGVREAAGAGFHFRELDTVAVKGRRGSLRIHELLGAAEGDGLAAPHPGGE